MDQLVSRWLTEAAPVDYLVPLRRWTVFKRFRSLAAVVGFALILITDVLLDGRV
jgi:hypothetical protein